MDFLDLVRRRYSCRAYLPDPVPRDALDRCIEAARLAPSACNSQPWRFIITAGPIKKRLAAAVFSGAYAMNAFAATAPVIVAVLSRPSSIPARCGGLLQGVPYHLIDLGIATEHFVLQATDEGLGTCWIGWFNARAARRILRLSRRERVNILLSVGKPVQPCTRPASRRPGEDIAEFRGDDSLTAG